MSCYNELIEKIRAKNYPKSETDSLMEWAFSALEKSDPHAYHEVMEKMEDLAYKMEQTDAESIVKAMKPSGEKWTYRDIKDVTAAHGITGSCTEWYLVMNMMWNDYHGTAEKFGHGSDVEFYYQLAYDFIMDPDGKNHKVAKYFHM